MLDFMEIVKQEEKKDFDLSSAIEAAAILLKNQYAKHVRKFAEEAKKLEIIDDESEKIVVEKAGEIKFLEKQIETKRKDIIKDHDAFVRKVNALAKSFKDILTPALIDLKDKVSNYQYKKELARREREKKAFEEQKRMQEQMKKEAKAKGIDAPEMPAFAPVEKKQTVTRAETGASAHIRTEWTYEVEDFSRLSDDYKTTDDKKIKGMVKAGIRNIEGLRIFEKPITILRA